MEENKIDYEAIQARWEKVGLLSEIPEDNKRNLSLLYEYGFQYFESILDKPEYEEKYVTMIFPIIYRLFKHNKLVHLFSLIDDRVAYISNIEGYTKSNFFVDLSPVIQKFVNRLKDDLTYFLNSQTVKSYISEMSVFPNVDMECELCYLYFDYFNIDNFNIDWD